MPSFLKTYYDTEGPLGLPMKDRQAQALDERLKALPEELRRLKRVVIDRAPTETLEGERSDVSWISTEDPDRDREVVIARGMDDSHFRLNPIVTMQHAYWLPPVGRSLWRKRVTDGSRVGIKAKTQYPPRPASWPEDAEWPADCAFTLVQADLLRGKSIGFLPTRVHVPDDREREKHNWPDVRLVIDEWILLEYACVFLPAQQNAVVESVSKGLRLPEPFRALLAELFQIDPEALSASATARTLGGRIIPFTPLEEIEKAFRRRLAAIDLEALVRRCVQESLDRARGRV
ncbi:MAG TPA: hypothetical protein VNK04_21055 [Gemmataceae bacterium]|nr:hypothetical protein [Gemmataceae bacterium]